jgi:hypothetical protein
MVAHQKAHNDTTSWARIREPAWESSRDNGVQRQMRARCSDDEQRGAEMGSTNGEMRAKVVRPARGKSSEGRAPWVGLEGAGGWGELSRQDDGRELRQGERWKPGWARAPEMRGDVRIACRRGRRR